MSPRIVSVFGATGQQGSAVAHALLKDGIFKPRAIVRNPDSDAGKKLAADGIDVVKGDSLDKASLVAALNGSEAVFAMTAPIFPLSDEGPNEFVQGTNIVDAAKEAGVKFIIWSGMPSIEKLSGGKYKHAVHYDQKGRVEEHLRASGIPFASLYLGGFLENLWKFGNLKPTDNGGYNIAIPRYLPGQEQAFTWVDRDIPQAALALLNAYTDPAKLATFNGKGFPVVNAQLPYDALAKRIGDVLGVEVTFTTIPATGMPAMDDMFDAQREFNGLYADTPVPNPGLTALGVKLGTLEEFLEEEVKARYAQGGSKAHLLQKSTPY